MHTYTLAGFLDDDASRLRKLTNTNIQRAFDDEDPSYFDTADEGTSQWEIAHQLLNQALFGDQMISFANWPLLQKRWWSIFAAKDSHPLPWLIQTGDITLINHKDGLFDEVFDSSLYRSEERLMNFRGGKIEDENESAPSFQEMISCVKKFTSECRGIDLKSTPSIPKDEEHVSTGQSVLHLGELLGGQRTFDTLLCQWLDDTFLVGQELTSSASAATVAVFLRSEYLKIRASEPKGRMAWKAAVSRLGFYHKNGVVSKSDVFALLRVGNDIFLHAVANDTTSRLGTSGNASLISPSATTAMLTRHFSSKRTYRVAGLVPDEVVLGKTSFSWLKSLGDPDHSLHKARERYRHARSEMLDPNLDEKAFHEAEKAFDLALETYHVEIAKAWQSPKFKVHARLISFAAFLLEAGAVMITKPGEHYISEELRLGLAADAALTVVAHKVVAYGIGFLEHKVEVSDRVKTLFPRNPGVPALEAGRAISTRHEFLPFWSNSKAT